MRIFIPNADGTSSYVTHDKDMVDDIAQDFYGTQIKTAEHVYDANPDLSLQPMILPAGVVIVLPPFTPPASTSEHYELWT